MVLDAVWVDAGRSGTREEANQMQQPRRLGGFWFRLLGWPPRARLAALLALVLLVPRLSTPAAVAADGQGPTTADTPAPRLRVDDDPLPLRTVQDMPEADDDGFGYSQLVPPRTTT